ncbi:MAG: hypothetical protein JRJ79_05610 [Deltaproteobacteria bacterium]|nr:hypothetical protein [Deltaproteobacteria bacterium]MBW1795102.1 hypothetical protein [Deltaproteobacteria bacterium]
MNIVEPFAYGNSFVHRLDPRVKIITAGLFSLLCRGFKGEFYILERCELHASDWLFGIISLLFIAELVVI